ERRAVPVVRPSQDGWSTRPTRLDTLGLADALRVLVGAGDAGPVVNAWAAVARLTLELATRGAVVPWPVGTGDVRWGASWASADDRARLKAIAAAMPPA